MKRNPKPRLTLEQRAQRRLKRLAARRLKAMPLFVATGTADQFTPLPSIQAIKNDICHRQQDVIRRVLTNYRHALHQAYRYRCLVQAQVSPTTFRRLLARRSIYPPTPEYTADFWRRTYNNLVNPP